MVKRESYEAVDGEPIRTYYEESGVVERVTEEMILVRGM